MEKKIEFFVPINESYSDSKGFMIKGTAINETTTLNGITYIAEELRPAASSFRNKPVLKDHKNSVDSIVGRTTENVNFNEMNKSIDFEAKILDKEMQNKIKEGLINSVSIGAYVESAQSEGEGENKRVVARGIRGVELSLVAVPADQGATFTKALYEMSTEVEVPEESSSSELSSDKEEEEKMSDEKLSLLEKENEALKEKLRLLESQSQEEKSDFEKMINDVNKRMDTVTETLTKKEEAQKLKGLEENKKEEETLSVFNGLKIEKDYGTGRISVYAEKYSGTPKESVLARGQ